MLRTAGKIIGAAGGVAATGAPQQAQCRAQQQRQRVLPGQKEESAKASLPVCKPAEHEEDGGWVLPDLDHLEECLAGGQSVLAPEEIDSAVQVLLGYSGAKPEPPAAAAAATAQPGSSATSDSASDSASEVFDPEEVDCQFRAAEAQLRDVQRGSAIVVSHDFNRMVTTLLQDTGVQSACLQALRRDPAFRDFCAAAEKAHAHAQPLPPLPSLLPPAARPAAAGRQGGAQPRGFFQSLALGAINLAAAVGSAAAEARDALGRLFLGLGQNILDLLHGEEGQAAGRKEPSQAGADSPQERQVGNLVILCAIAVFSLVVLKRVGPIRLR